MIEPKQRTKSWVPLAVVVALYLVLATTYSVVTPLGEGPDEPGHAAYVFFLASAGRLPDQRRNEVAGEGHQPPLAYLLALPAALLTDAGRFDLPGNPQFVWAGGTQPNAVAHGNSEFWPWRGAVLAWHMMRLVSAACGAATVVLTYLTARRLPIAADQSVIPLLAASLVALNPQFLFISGLVSNDPLLAALCALTLWLCVRGSVQQPGRFDAPLLGLVLGLALLTKLSALVLVPMIALAMLVPGGLPKAARPALQQRRQALLVVGVAALVCGWWFVRNWQLYGDPFGLAAFQPFRTQPFDFASTAAWQAALGQLFSSYWARFGWMNILPPIAVWWAFAGLVALAVFGWIVAARRANQAVLALVLAATTFAWVLVFARTAGLVAWQGRLLFPAASAIALLLAIGLAGAATVLRRLVRLPRQTWLLLPGAMAALAFWLPFGVIIPAYPQQTLPAAAALARPLTPLQARFAPTDEPVIELRGWTLGGTAQAGNPLDLTLLWQALGRQRRNWTVFLHLVDEQGNIVFADNRQPRNGAFPTGQWATGDWVEDSRTFRLPPTLAPGRYFLRVGLYDTGTLERPAVQNAVGELIGDSVVLGSLNVER